MDAKGLLDWLRANDIQPHACDQGVEKIDGKRYRIVKIVVFGGLTRSQLELLLEQKGFVMVGGLVGYMNLTFAYKLRERKKKDE